MTVASEITRLNTAKSCLKASIEAKWVTVWNSVSLSCYYKCVDEIQTWSWYNIDVLVVWWWWSGWWSKYINSRNWYPNWWGWGWGWWVIEVLKGSFWNFYGNSVCVQVWCASWWCNRWCDSYFGALKACWGWKWGRWRYSDPWEDGSTTWWSWWGWGTCPWSWNQWCPWISWQWYAWADACPWQWAWWGWWAWWPAIWCNWGIWYLSCITWTPTYYGWGWGWGWHSSDACAWVWWCWWWWPWAYCWWVVNNKCGTYYWWWGWGATCDSWGWPWYQWIVIVRYPTDWSYWFTTATWWNCCVTCNWYKIHCFTSNWTFTIVS